MTGPARQADLDDVETIDNQMLGQSLKQRLGDLMGQNLSHDPNSAVDFAFLVAQTFADSALERDVLALFVGQMRKILPLMVDMSAKDQADTAHLLKGSAQGIGAWAAADAAAAYEASPPDQRHLALPGLLNAFAAAEHAIETRLAML